MNLKFKKKVLIVFGSGGHQRQMTILSGDLIDKYDIVAVFCQEDYISPKLMNFKHHFVKRPRISDEGHFKYIVNTLTCFFQSISLILKERPSAVIACGPSVSVPVMYAGKLLGLKVIFIESWSVLYEKSLTGKLIYPIADQFFVQWESMKSVYKRAIYRGRFIV
jgi:beta-1,4-N-acetylglucosaminyltransferase